MLETLSTYLPLKKTLLALEHTKHDDKSIIYGVEVVQKKGELDISNTLTVTYEDNIAALVDKITQVSVVINDDQILSKEVSNIGTDAEIVTEAFPNLNLNDFYYQILRTTHTSFIAVCRKQYVETVIKAYQKESIKITNISLGTLKMTSLSSFAERSTVCCSTVEVSYTNGEVSSIDIKGNSSQEHYTIEGLTFSSTHALPLSVVVDKVIGTSTISGNIEIKNQELQKNYNESRFFKNTLQFGVGFLLVTLLINFFVFNANYKKWQGLQEELQVYTKQQQLIKNKQANVHTKEALVQSILTTGFSKSSYAIDQIIQALPNTVVLTTFAYQPLEKPIRKDKTIALKAGVISIKGKSTDKELFTTWLRTIEKLSFVETVTIAQYGLDKKNTSDFELMIMIKPNGAKN